MFAKKKTTAGWPQYLDHGGIHLEVVADIRDV
jgi:hypothetical protein